MNDYLGQLRKGKSQNVAFYAIWNVLPKDRMSQVMTRTDKNKRFKAINEAVYNILISVKNTEKMSNRIYQD